MKEKVYGICLTKVFREESYGQPEITLCKTREIAHREFIDIVSNRLDDWLPDEYENEDGISKDFMTVEQKVFCLKEEGYDLSYIHYTGVAPWYAKLGYRTILKWDRHGIL